MQGLLKTKNLVQLLKLCNPTNQRNANSLYKQVSYQFFKKKASPPPPADPQVVAPDVLNQGSPVQGSASPLAPGSSQQQFLENGVNSSKQQEQFTSTFSSQSQQSSISPGSGSESSTLLDTANNAEFSLKIDDPSLFNNLYLSEHDIGNVASAIGPLNEYQSADFISKLSYLTPGQIYEQLDLFTRESLFYLANEMGWGLGLAIAGVSLGIKMFFMPMMIGTQVNAVKMKLLEPEMKNFNNQVQRLSKMGDYAGVREAQRQFAKMRRQHGIKNWLTVLSLTQIPVLITWFLSLRYIANMPDKYPQLKTEGLLWFKDLSVMDPYCILPVISATLSYYNISLNPNLSNSSAGGSILGKYMRYMRFLPFFSLPIVLFFPAALNLYWAISAATHLMVAVIVRTPQTRKVFGIPDYLPGTILERMNQKYTAKVIKTVISDTPKATAEKIASAMMGGGSGNIKDKIQVFANKPKIVQANAGVSDKNSSQGNLNKSSQQQQQQENSQSATSTTNTSQQQQLKNIQMDQQQSKQNIKQSQQNSSKTIINNNGQEGVQIFTNKPRRKKQ